MRNRAPDKVQISSISLKMMCLKKKKLSLKISCGSAMSNDQPVTGYVQLADHQLGQPWLRPSHSGCSCRSCNPAGSGLLLRHQELLRIRGQHAPHPDVRPSSYSPRFWGDAGCGPRGPRWFNPETSPTPRTFRNGLMLQSAVQCGVQCSWASLSLLLQVTLVGPAN